MIPLRARDQARAEILRALNALNEHLADCPYCLKEGYGLCQRGFVLSGALVRARSTGEARGVGSSRPSPAGPTGIGEVAPELSFVP